MHAYVLLDDDIISQCLPASYYTCLRLIRRWWFEQLTRAGRLRLVGAIWRAVKVWSAGAQW